MIDWKWVGIIVGIVAVIAGVILGVSAYKTNKNTGDIKSNVLVDTISNKHIDINPVIPPKSNSADKKESNVSNSTNPPANQTPWQQGPSIPPPQNTPWGQGPSQ